MIGKFKIQEGGKQAKLIEEVQTDKGISSREYELKNTSQYVPDEFTKARIQLVREAFTLGDLNLRKPRREFNDLSLLNRLQIDQMAFNNYLPSDGDYNEGDSISSWRSNAQRPITRNKIMSIGAHLASKTIVPKVFASNKESEVQEDVAEVMGILMEHDAYKAKYDKLSLYAILTALFSPACIVYREYAENYITVKTDKTNGKWNTEQILNEEFSGPQATIVPVDEFFISNPYESNVQKQDWVIWRKVISYDNAMMKYGTNENFKYITPGMQVIYNDANQTFYEVYDYNMRGSMVEEVIYWNKAFDLRLVIVNGVLVTDPDEANPRKDKKYPFAKFYYESLDEGKFFYGMSLSQKMMQDSKIINQLYQITLDGSLLKIMPPMVATGGEMIGNNVMIPGYTTTLTSIDSKLSPIDTGIDITAGMNAIQLVQQSIDDTTVSPISQGQAAGGTQTAFEISKLEQNAQTMGALTLKMIGDYVAQYGDLQMGDILQYNTVADVGDILGKDTLSYKTFLLPPSAGRNQAVRVAFENIDPMSEDQNLNASYDILGQSEKSNQEIYKVNPSLFRICKYSLIISPDILNPKSKDLERAYKLEGYDRMILNPNVDQEKVTKDFLLGAYSDLFPNMDKYINDKPAPLPVVNPSIGATDPAMNPSAGLLNNTNQITNK